MNYEIDIDLIWEQWLDTLTPEEIKSLSQKHAELDVALDRIFSQVGEEGITPTMQWSRLKRY